MFGRFSLSQAAALAALVLLPAPLLGDDLRDALNAAYATNPVPQGARAQKRATDENVPIAKAAGRPVAERRVDAGKFDLRGTESAIFSQTVAAYMDVILNQTVVGLGRKNIAPGRSQLLPGWKRSL